MNTRPRVLFVHSRPAIGQATRRVLESQGFAVDLATSGVEARAALAGQSEHAPIRAVVVDVALPDVPGFELVGVAREHEVKTVILVASVYRRTAYKRRPSKLYGADDYVEIHHLGDHLPERLRSHLGLEPAGVEEDEARAVYEALRGEGDTRMNNATPEGLASLIVADLLLYNGEVVAEAEDVEEAEAAVASDLESARRLFAQVGGASRDGVDPIGEAFRDLFEHIEIGVTR